jgi:hypothetical protein
MEFTDRGFEYMDLFIYLFIFDTNERRPSLQVHGFK